MLKYLCWWILAALSMTACTPNALGDPADPPMQEGVVESVEESVEVSNPSVSMEPGTVEIIGGDEASLREFMEWYMAGPGSTGSTRAFIGSLPDEMPFDIPIPEGARVIGSVIAQPQPQYGYTQILLEVTGSQEDVEAFYAEAFSGDGWTQPQMGQQGGFVSSGYGPQLGYCHSEADIAVSLMLGERDAGHLGVTLMMQENAQYTACGSQVMEGPGDAGNMIPMLSAPQGAQQNQQGGGGGMGTGFVDSHTTASVITDLAPAELADHYNEQIEADGWTLVSSGKDDNAAWSTWTRAEDGEAWTARLVVFRRNTEEPSLFAWMQVEQISE